MLSGLCGVRIGLTHAGDDAVDWQAGESVVDCLGHSSGISSRAAPRRLLLAPDKCRVLLLGDIDVKARVRGPHDVAGTRVQQDVGGLQSAHSNHTYSISAKTGSALNGAGSHFLAFSHYDLLFVSMKGGKGEALALVFPEEFTFLQADVMHLIG